MVHCSDGDTVLSIATANNIPLAAFIDANPQLAGDPLLLWRGYDYCVPQSPINTPAQIPVESGKEYNPTSQSATGTGEPEQTANGSGYYPVSGVETGNNVLFGPTNVGSKQAAEPTAAEGDSADGPAAVESGDASKNTPDDMEEADSSMVGSSTTSNSSSAAGSQSTAASGQSAASSSQSAAIVQSPASAESATERSQPTLVTQTTADSQASQSPESSTASPGSGSDSGFSTLTTAILAPTQDEQNGAPTGAADRSEKSADGLAQSFGAVPRAVLWGSHVDPSRMVWTQSSGKTYALYKETVTSDGKTSTSTITVHYFKFSPADIKSVMSE